MDNDRTLHGETTVSGVTYEIVRYDVAGKWYFEPLDAPQEKRWPAKVGTAAEGAALGVWYQGRAGGRTFDSRVRAFRGLMKGTITNG